MLADDSYVQAVDPESRNTRSIFDVHNTVGDDGRMERVAEIVVHDIHAPCVFAPDEARWRAIARCKPNSEPSFRMLSSRITLPFDPRKIAAEKAQLERPAKFWRITQLRTCRIRIDRITCQHILVVGRNVRRRLPWLRYDDDCRGDRIVQLQEVSLERMSTSWEKHRKSNGMSRRTSVRYEVRVRGTSRRRQVDGRKASWRTQEKFRC